MYDIFKLLKERVSILVEYSARSIPGVALFKLLHQVREQHDNNVEIVLTDFLDTLAIYKYQADFSDIPTTDIIDTVKVIKVGGKLNVGNVISKIPVSGYSIYKTLYEEALAKINYNDKIFTLNIQVGLENLMNLFERRELIEQVHDIGEYIVTKKDDIRDVIFLNIDAIQKVSIEILPILNVVIPVISRLDDKGASLTITKSVLPELAGMKIEL